MSPTRVLSIIWEAALIVAAGIIMFGTHDRRTFVVLSALFCVTLLAKMATRGFPKDPLDVENTSEMGDDAVDPWDFQRQLMAISDQRMPAVPTLTNEVVLYAALIEEELGETLHGLNLALGRLEVAWCRTKLVDDPQLKALRRLRRVTVGLRECAAQANYMRDQVSIMGSFSFPLTTGEAVELLDGATDIAVVNCGFALAAGLPGREGYSEVALSNISKANPDTGKIDKDPSGKWIKGRDYRKPNLVKVLLAQRAS